MVQLRSCRGVNMFGCSVRGMERTQTRETVAAMGKFVLLAALAFGIAACGTSAAQVEAAVAHTFPSAIASANTLTSDAVETITSDVCTETGTTTQGSVWNCAVAYTQSSVALGLTNDDFTARLAVACNSTCTWREVSWAYVSGGI